MSKPKKSKKSPLGNIKTPLLTVDSVLFTYHEKALKILLVQRSSEPEKGKWGLPGGIVDIDIDKDIEATVLRKLVEKTSVEPPYLDQLETVGNRKRDPRGWSVTWCAISAPGLRATRGYGRRRALGRNRRGPAHAARLRS